MPVGKAAARGGHIVTGGTSGLGLLTGRWLAQRGACRLVLASRSGVLIRAAMAEEWEALQARATQPHCLPLQGLRDMLAASVQRGTLHCGRRVVSLTNRRGGELWLCLLYTSDAADD